MKNVLSLLISCALLFAASGALAAPEPAAPAAPAAQSTQSTPSTQSAQSAQSTQSGPAETPSAEAAPAGAAPTETAREESPAEIRQRLALAEAAVDEALPPSELCDMVERLMPLAEDTRTYLPWEFFESQEDFRWDPPYHYTGSYRPSFQSRYGRTKIRTAGKIFTTSILLGTPREVPWTLIAYDRFDGKVCRVALRASGWSPKGGASGPEFDLHEALAVSGHLKITKIAEYQGTKRNLYKETSTAYILEAPGRRTVILEYILPDIPFPVPNVVLHYNVGTTQQEVMLGLEYAPETWREPGQAR